MPIAIAIAESMTSMIVNSDGENVIITYFMFVSFLHIYVYNP